MTGKDRILLYVNPVIIENGKKYWGYPWDVTKMKARTDGRITELYCSLDHKIIREANEENNPKHQKLMPVIFFAGHHTQDFEPEGIKNEKWMTLQDIIEQIRR